MHLVFTEVGYKPKTVIKTRWRIRDRGWLTTIEKTKNGWTEYLIQTAEDSF